MGIQAIWWPSPAMTVIPTVTGVPGECHDRELREILASACFASRQSRHRHRRGRHLASEGELCRRYGGAASGLHRRRHAFLLVGVPEHVPPQDLHDEELE